MNINSPNQVARTSARSVDVKRIALALESRARYVNWRDVQSWDDGVVRLRIQRDQLKRLTEIT